MDIVKHPDFKDVETFQSDSSITYNGPKRASLKISSKDKSGNHNELVIELMPGDIITIEE